MKFGKSGAKIKSKYIPIKIQLNRFCSTFSKSGLIYILPLLRIKKTMLLNINAIL